MLMVVLSSIVIAAVTSWALLGALIPQLSRRLLDQPNARSSHRRPTPRGGGVAFVLVATAASLLALAITGFVGARLGESPALKPVLRVLAGVTFALLLTWGIGTALGVAGI